MADITVKLILTEQAICDTEMATRGQRDNAVWSMIRTGRVIDSNYGSILRCIDNGRQPPKSLLKVFLGEYDLSGLKTIQWGCNHESTAIAVYEQSTGVKVQSSGIWLSKSGYLGASPDGIVDVDMIIEIK